MSRKRKVIRGVEYSVGLAVERGYDAKVFDSFDEAAGYALAHSAATGGYPVNLDVLVYSESAAYAYGGDDAVEQYREDPEASVFDRIEISIKVIGRVP